MGWRLRLSDKTVRKFAELCYTVSDKHVAQGWQYKFMQIFAGVLWRGRKMRVWSLKMATCASFVHCLSNILHTWPHDSFHVIRLSMTLAIFQGHRTVSHQIPQ